MRTGNTLRKAHPSKDRVHRCESRPVEQSTSRPLEVAEQVCGLASGRSVFTGPAETARRDVGLLHSYTGAAA
jgi:hypothetical protein